MNKFGFYFKDLLLALKHPLPAITFGVLLAILILITIWITKKITDGSWKREPEKIDKLISYKLQAQGEKIRLLKMHIRKVQIENIELRNLLKGIRSLLNAEKKR